MQHQTEVHQSPIFLALSSLNLKPKAAETLMQASKVGTLSTGEMLSIIPAAMLNDETKLNRAVEWIMQLCDALEIVILPTSSKSRLEREVSSGKRVASYEPPAREAEIRKRYRLEDAASEAEEPEEGVDEPAAAELSEEPDQSHLE